MSLYYNPFLIAILFRCALRMSPHDDCCQKLFAFYTFSVKYFAFHEEQYAPMRNNKSRMFSAFTNGKQMIAIISDDVPDKPDEFV